MNKTHKAKGFTLIEIIIVMIIVGVLATLGLTQYSAIIEKSRGGEAKEVLGSIRKAASGHHMQYGVLNGATPFTAAEAGIGTGGVPAACVGTHYFSYAIAAPAANSVLITATRCGATGKGGTAVPQTGTTLTLEPNFATGDDPWGGTGNYR